MKPKIESLFTLGEVHPVVAADDGQVAGCALSGRMVTGSGQLDRYVQRMRSE